MTSQLKSSFFLSVVFFPILTLMGCKARKDEVVVSGYIEAKKVDITPRLYSRILEVRVDEGDHVLKGDTLIVLDSREFDTSLKEANLKIDAGKAKIEQVEAQLSLAEDRLKNFEDLYSSGSLPEEKLKDLRTKVKVLKASLKEAEKTLEATEKHVDLLKIERDECFITSPIRGVVLDRTSEPGEMALPGVSLLVVAPIDTLKMVAFLPEREMGKISAGDTAFISVDAFPDTLFRGIVSKINDEAVFVPKNIQTEEERTKLVFETDILIPNKEGFLKPGMFANAKFRLFH